jgi:hypothetical protein
MDTLEMNKGRVVKVLFILITILSAYFAVRIFSEIKKDSMLGESSVPATISFSGHGEIQAVPDIANVSFNITKDSKLAKDAQDAVATVEKSALDFLKTSNVDSKDIKTQNASVNPTYQYQNSICPQPIPMTGGSTSASSVIYCPPGKSVQTGYEAQESITVKIRNTDDVGKIMQGLGGLGVSNLNGPNFAIDNPESVQAQARTLAIADAKAKAKELAKELGVSLGKIASFNESGNNYPIMYASDAMLAGKATPASAPAVIPSGQNTISSDVTITYEIR